jgi:uncharacterized protein (DUF2342 family)
MAAFATAVLKNWDGDLTGATGAVNFVPSSIDANGVATWVAPGSVFDANKKLSMSVRLPAKGSQVARVQVKLAHPVMDSVDPTLKIGECLVNVEFVFPKRADSAARSVLVGNLVEFFNNNAAFGAAVTALESVY